MIDGITFRDGDCVLDCGANVGEVSLWFRRRYPKVRIIAVEPEELEANCVDINVFGGQPQTVRKVLWKEDGALPFFTKPESADSSLFQIADHGAVTTVPATTVASLLAEQNVPRLRLLKLEAEGAEPEIIQGCGDFLDRIDYIAADCGPERGLAQDETATDLINYLLPRNFELLDMRFDRVTCLFRNRNAVP
jgi:FkbM family methyltransferase